MKMCGYIIFTLLVFAVPCLQAQTVPASAGEKLIASFEGGRLYRSGKINLVVLQGSYRKMGRQYGHLLSDELHGLYKNAVVDYFQKQKGLSPEAMKKTAMSLYRFYPQRFKDILSGMAETSGLSLENHIVLNALELYGAMPACSGIIAWGAYTKNRPLIAGRNYDWFPEYGEFARNLTVTVFKPASGIPHATLTFAGVIYATTGLNARGVFLELNNASPSGGTMSYANRLPAVISLLAFLGDFATLDQLDAAFNTTRPNFAFIINTADTSRGLSYEWAPFAQRRRTGDSPGLLVATNHFTDPSWGLVLQDTGKFETVQRRNNLLALGHKNKGAITVKTMQEILDTGLNDGGATWPLDGSILTVYQIIVRPESRQLWVKVPGFQNWTGIDMKHLFKK